MEYKKKCPICGRLFTTNRETNLYCGPDCQAAARRKRDREHKRLTRAAGAAERKRALEEREQVRTEKANSRRQRARDIFSLRCAAGDIHALLIREKATGGNRSRRYWELFALVSIKEAESIGKDSRVIVNGHSVYEDTFPENVLESIKERGFIYIELSGRQHDSKGVIYASESD